MGSPKEPEGEPRGAHGGPKGGPKGAQRSPRDARRTPRDPQMTLRPLIRERLGVDWVSSGGQPGVWPTFVGDRCPRGGPAVFDYSTKTNNPSTGSYTPWAVGPANYEWLLF